MFTSLHMGPKSKIKTDVEPVGNCFLTHVGSLINASTGDVEWISKIDEMVQRTV